MESVIFYQDDRQDNVLLEFHRQNPNKPGPKRPARSVQTPASIATSSQPPQQNRLTRYDTTFAATWGAVRSIRSQTAVRAYGSQCF